MTKSLCTSAIGDKPFAELNEDEKLILAFEHLLIFSDNNIDEMDLEWWEERRSVCRYVREKLDFMREFHKIDRGAI